MNRLPTFTQCRKPILVSLALVYFGFHLMNGERGVYAYLRETHKQNALEQEYQKVHAQRESLELKVSGLRNDSLDLDILDEQARAMIGMIGEGEKIILLNPAN